MYALLYGIMTYLISFFMGPQKRRQQAYQPVRIYTVEPRDPRFR
jgi:hypothetical protein